MQGHEALRSSPSAPCLPRLALPGVTVRVDGVATDGRPDGDFVCVVDESRGAAVSFWRGADDAPHPIMSRASSSSY